MSLAIRDVDECWDVAVRIEQGVHFDGGLMVSELRPRKQRQAEIDGGGIQSVQVLVEIHAAGISGVERSRNAD